MPDAFVFVLVFVLAEPFLPHHRQRRVPARGGRHRRPAREPAAGSGPAPGGLARSSLARVEKPAHVVIALPPTNIATLSIKNGPAVEHSFFFLARTALLWSPLSSF